MKNKKMIGLVIGFVIVALISFYAGSKYASAKNSAPLTQNANGFVRNGGTNSGANGAQRGMRVGGGFVSGQIISKDANSITVELRALSQNSPAGGAVGQNSTDQGQGSKIVFYTDKTSITKTTDGTLNDLTLGKQVSINGTANPDGSLSAASIQVR